MFIWDDLSLVLIMSVVFANIFLAWYVFSNDSRKLNNQLFAVLSIMTTIWLVVAYIAPKPYFVSQILFLTRLNVFIAVPHVVSFFLLSMSLAKRIEFLKRKYLMPLFLVSLSLMVFIFSPYVFSDVVVDGSLVSPIPNWGIVVFASFIVFLSGFSVFVLIKRYIQATGIEKQQLKYVTYGIFLLLTLIILTILIPLVFFNNIFFITFAPVYVFIFLLMTAYAIVKYHLFEVKIIVTEFLVFILWIVLFSRIFSSASLSIFIVDVFVFTITAFVGIWLIKSVLKEVAQREELQRFSIKLKSANKNLKELLEMKSEFISIASHQLRTPLTALRGLLDMQVNGDFEKLPKERQYKFQKNMLTSADRLNSLVNDLLGATQMEGGVKMVDTSIDINKVIGEAIDSLQRDYDVKGLYLKFRKGKIPNINGDSRYIREVFLNLIDNAEKYTEKGGVTVSTKKVDGFVEIKVKDTGMGVTKEERNEIFNKLHRGERATILHQNGSGLGLYIVKKVVDAHSGTIDAQSKGVGKGTTFIVRLPIVHPKN